MANIIQGTIKFSGKLFCGRSKNNIEIKPSKTPKTLVNENFSTLRNKEKK